MKRLSVLLILCLALSAPALAETSSADRFLNNLSMTWDSFLDMAQDAGDSVAEWADESGVADWAQGALDDVSAWVNDSGVGDWAKGALDDLAAWYGESGISEWAEGAAGDIEAFIEENRPAVEAWLAGAGEEVRHAWDTLVNPDGHTEDEVREAYAVVADSLEAASEQASGE